MTQRIGVFQKRIELLVRFEFDALDDRELHAKFMAQEKIELVVMGKKFQIALTELVHNYGPMRHETCCEAYAYFPEPDA